MFGPYQLTRVVLVLLCIAFASVMAYMFLYNIRQKSRLKGLQQRGFRSHSKAEEIIAEQQAARSLHGQR